MPNYPNAIQSKLPKVGTTIFTIMSGLANEHGAVNLSQGFPDFQAEPALFDAGAGLPHRPLHPTNSSQQPIGFTFFFCALNPDYLAG